MKKLFCLALISFAFFSFTNYNLWKAEPLRKINFPSTDGLPITADLYFVNDSLPYMVLCHQAGSSRGEYAETADKFCRLGYNCIAIDARSGNEVNGVINETAQLAASEKKSTQYLDAERDILSAIDYANKQNGKKIVLVGSSYSASIALKLAATNPKIGAVIAFSPGNYFGSTFQLKDVMNKLSVPAFVTSSKDESSQINILMSDVKLNIVKQFIPTSQGKHGSSCLWKNSPGYNEYWAALFMFLHQFNS